MTTRFIDTDAGLVNVDRIVSILNRPREKSPGSLDCVTVVYIDANGEKTVTKAIGDEDSHLDEINATIVPAQPGYYLLSAWKNSESTDIGVTKCDIVAWHVNGERWWKPVCIETTMHHNQPEYVLTPSGVVFEPCSGTYDSVEEWKQAMRQEMLSK